MLAMQSRYAKRLVGQSVRVACLNGTTSAGQLISFDGRSLWLTEGDSDTFVPINHVVALTPVAL